MGENGVSAGELALMQDNGGFGGNNAFFWIFALLLLAGGGFGGFGGNHGNYVTQADLTNGLNNQQTQAQLSQIALSSANNNYETAQLINSQTNQMLQQNNTNLINAIQGFNQMQQTMNANTNQLAQAIQQLGYQMDQCCCSIKTQILQNRYEDTQAQLVAAQGAISNANQSQYLLGQLGRFVAWTPSGSQAATSN